MILTPQLRKLVLAVHITCSVGWIGAVVAYLVLGVSAVTSSDALTVRAAWIAMELTGWFAIVPLALAALLTGLIISLGTAWGLFRHYWVLISLGLTGPCRWAWRRSVPPRCRPAGAAGDHSAQYLQAARRDPLWLA